MSELREHRPWLGPRTPAVAEGKPIIAVAPQADGPFPGAIEAAGGIPSSKVKGAAGLVWTDPYDTKGLAKAIKQPGLRWIQLPFAGIETFFRDGVIDGTHLWTCAKGIYGPATAEHALTLMLAASRRLHDHIGAQGWRFGGFGTPERRLKGSAVLIVGTGGIGRSLAAMLQPLGPRILAVNRRGAPLEGAEVTEPVENLPHLLVEADHVVLACALTPQTRGLFDRAMLEYMKPHAWLINVGRGGLVVTNDLVRALQEGSIGGAALDVTDPEPLPVGHPLWTMDNVIITPHVANTWDMALPELSELVRRNVEAFIDGRPLEGIVDPVAGY